MIKSVTENARLIANGIMIHVQGKTGRVVYNTKEKSFAHNDLMSAARQGYERAEKDLALTWYDMAKIDAIILDLNNEFAVDYSKEISRQKFYEEVLKRFNEQRKK